MTTSNYIGLIVLLAQMVLFCLLKARTRRILSDLDGYHGIYKGSGKLIGKY